MKCSSIATLVLISLWGCVLWPSVHAAPGDLIRDYHNPDAISGDNFGMEIAVLDGNVLVGAATGNHVGAVYSLDGASGGLLRTFTHPEPEPNDYFGEALAVVGGNVLVGARGDNTGATGAGSAFLFSGSTGELIHTFHNPTPEFDDRFGWSVCGSDSRVVIGASYDHTIGFETGVVYVFDATTGDLVHTLQNPSPDYNDCFGTSLAMIGDNILVGAHGDDTTSPNGGAVYLFDGDSGELIRAFENPTPEAGDYFGHRVAAMGDNVLVGAYRDNTAGQYAGAVYLFDGSTGDLLQTFLNPNGEDDYFSVSIAAVGDDVLVGAHTTHDLDLSYTGIAYLFDGQKGTLLHTIHNPAPNHSDYFGCSVATLEDDILVAAHRDDTYASDAGIVYRFEAIPEPSTLALLCMGAFGLLAYSWRRRNK